MIFTCLGINLQYNIFLFMTDRVPMQSLKIHVISMPSLRSSYSAFISNSKLLLMLSRTQQSIDYEIQMDRIVFLNDSII